MVYYPHGSLFLATNFLGEEKKLARSDKGDLLEEILSRWGEGNDERDCIPLFVSEGLTRDKLRRIKQSNYLDTVYDSELSKLEESLVIYGWSIGNQDTHILDALEKGKLKEIAISVHEEGGSWQPDCNEVEATIIRNSALRECELFFFDAQSEGCWIH